MTPPTAILALASPEVRTFVAFGPFGSGAHTVDFSAWGALEWVGYSAMTLVCIWVLWRAVRTTLHPGEEGADHVKRSILDDDATPFGRASTTAESARLAADSPTAPRARH